MNTPSSLNVFQRSIAFCLAAMITFGLLGGIDQLAHQPQADANWAAATSAAPRG